MVSKNGGNLTKPRFNLHEKTDPRIEFSAVFFPEYGHIAGTAAVLLDTALSHHRDAGVLAWTSEQLHPYVKEESGSNSRQAHQSWALAVSEKNGREGLGEAPRWILSRFSKVPLTERATGSMESSASFWAFPFSTIYETGSSRRFVMCVSINRVGKKNSVN